jgi:hypothetical protein
LGGALCRLGGLDGCEFGLGAVDLGGEAECGCDRDSFCGRLWFERLSFRFDKFSVRLLLLVEAPFAGGVNGRNPSFEFPLFPVGATRASFGDMAGA